jgi:hypothetical protein
MSLLRRRDDHAWSQRHLSHYVEGDLGWLARRRLELHAEECIECGPGIRAVRALVRVLHGTADRPAAPAPAGIFDLVRAEASRAPGDEDQAHGA